MSVEWWWSCQNTFFCFTKKKKKKYFGVILHFVFISRLSGKALLDFKYRNVVGLVGLCNRILHTMVYRLLLFSIGNAMCIFNCAEGSGIPHYIIACVTKYNYDCSLSMQSGSRSTFVSPSTIFLVVFRLSYVLYILYRLSLIHI